MERAVLHVDLDQFIVAVELLRRPELRGRPVLVGGTGDPSRRGVVAGASYEAREHGVRSGTPLRTAAARCPEAVFLPLDKPAYEAASEEFLAVLAGLVEVVEPAGWDEAFARPRPGDPAAAALAIQAGVREGTGLECSVGIGDNKLHAKLASGMAKPAGIFLISRSNWHEIMDGLPAEALWGIGRKTADKLATLGIGTVGELAAADPDALAARFGPVIGPWLVATALGLDADPVTANPPAIRSRGREVTFQRNLTDPDELRQHLRQLAAQVAADLAAEDQLARRVVVKVRQAPFITSSHGVPLPGPTRDAAALAEAALAAFGEFELHRPVRLVGVRAELSRE
jgi:DNA polymerase-4